MFAQRDQIMRDIFTRVAGESALMAQRVSALNEPVAALEQGHVEASQVVSHVAIGIGERVAADTNLRKELVEFSDKLKASENDVKAVHNEFGGHVAGAFSALDIKLQKLEVALNSATSSASGVAAGAFPAGVGNVMAAQTSELKVLNSAVSQMGEERVNVQLQLASLAARPCHCPDVDNLMV
jgi:hypothetical protein